LDEKLTANAKTLKSYKKLRNEGAESPSNS